MIGRILSAMSIVFLGFTALSQRNIVVIIADDLGSDWCGFQEDHKDTVTLKNVRSLLSRGVRFSRAWSTPYCSPTRAGILTGRYSFRHGIGTAIADEKSAWLKLDEITIPQLLKNSAAPTKYVCANVGKWHLHDGNSQTFNYPATFGYDYYAGVFSGTPTPSYFSWRKVTNGTPSLSNNYLTTETTTDAINWLNSQGSNPFFLWLAYNAVHFPYHLPPDSLHSYDQLSGTQADINLNPKNYFKAMAESMDYEIGKLINWLKAKNKFENTDIIFIGDNGDEERVAQGLIERSKGTVYEDGVHIPFIISGPSVKNPGRTSTALVSIQDIFATVLDLAGFTKWPAQIPTNRVIDSKSLLPILQNQVQEVRSWAYTEVFKTSLAEAVDSRAIRNNTYKLIHFDSGKQEFYDLGTDATESKNLLSRTLNAQEQENYQSLCKELSTLLGVSVCQQTTTAIRPADVNASRPIIYPNPARDIIYVHAPDVRSLHYRLFNSNGQHLFAGSASSSIPLTQLADGLYMLQIQGAQTLYTHKFMVVR